MRLLHTSDWHLGRLFHGVHLTEDQAHLLDQFVDLVEDTNPDLVLVAGDVFDRAVPPPEAVELLDQVLTRIVAGLKVNLLLIAGNHDSPVRLGFSSGLLASNGLHIRSDVRKDNDPIILETGSGSTAVYALPFAEPATVREKLNNPAALDHGSAMKLRLETIAEQPAQAANRIAVAHAFIAGGTESESERPLFVGGLATVEASLFKDFDFVALGHLHRPQSMKKDRLHYSGSLMKYSFSEADDRKSVSLVEIDPAGALSIEKISLTPRRDVRCIEGFFQDLLDEPPPDVNREDYLSVILLDKGPVWDALGRLREVYPNVLHIERPFLRPEGAAGLSAGDHKRMSELELFSTFYKQVIGEELTGPMEDTLVKILEKRSTSERIQ